MSDIKKTGLRLRAKEQIHRFHTISRYRPEYCDMLVEHMGNGLSFNAFAGVIKVSQGTLYKWSKKHPEFAEARTRGDAAALLYWEQCGKSGMLGEIKNFNPSVYIFSMKNKFDWTDRPEVKNLIEGDDSAKDHELLQECPRDELYKLIKAKKETEEDKDVIDV